MRFLAISVVFVSQVAFAAPTYIADYYPATSPQPDEFRLSINGAAPIACQGEALNNTLRPSCSLASITTPGTYSLVASAVYNASKCVTVSGATSCVSAGTYSSPAISYTLASGVGPVNGRVVP